MNGVLRIWLTRVYIKEDGSFTRDKAQAWRTDNITAYGYAIDVRERLGIRLEFEADR